jgi:hypothetical protein
MRKTILLAAVLIGCAKTEKAPVDTAAPAMAPAAPAAPAPLTAAEIKGTWKGTTKNAGTDSVVAKWTVKSTSDSTGTLTYDGTKVTVPFKTVLSADSMVATSDPFVPPSAKKGSPKVRFVSVGRVKDGQLTGTANIVLATKQDSILARHTYSATKAP